MNVYIEYHEYAEFEIKLRCVYRKINKENKSLLQL